MDSDRCVGRGLKSPAPEASQKKICWAWKKIALLSKKASIEHYRIDSQDLNWMDSELNLINILWCWLLVK